MQILQKTGQEQACSRIARSSVVCSFVILPNMEKYTEMWLLNAPCLVITSIGKNLLQTRTDQERGITGPAGLLHSWHWALYNKSLIFGFDCYSLEANIYWKRSLIGVGAVLCPPSYLRLWQNLLPSCGESAKAGQKLWWGIIKIFDEFTPPHVGFPLSPNVRVCQSCPN